MSTERLPSKLSGRTFRQEDPDVDPARLGIYATDLPSAAKNHTPHTNDFPRGWTIQQPWFHPEFPLPADVRCTMCAQTHAVGECGVVKTLVSLDAGAAP